MSRPHVGLTPVRARLNCPLSRLEKRAAAAATQAVSSASQSLRELVGAIARPHVGLTPVRALLHCPLSRLEIRAAAAAVQPVSSASQQ
eukprot:4521988-Prymnesium_polylepis.1